MLKSSVFKAENPHCFYSDSHFDSNSADMFSTMNWRQESFSCSALYMVENSSSSAAFFRVTEEGKGKHLY